MLPDIWKVIKVAVTLADDLQKYNAELKEIRLELRDLTIIVHALAQDNKNSKEQTDLKHENLLLNVDKRLQSIEKTLNPLPVKQVSKKRRR